MSALKDYPHSVLLPKVSEEMSTWIHEHNGVHELQVKCLQTPGGNGSNLTVWSTVGVSIGFKTKEALTIFILTWM